MNLRSAARNALKTDGATSVRLPNTNQARIAQYCYAFRSCPRHGVDLSSDGTVESGQEPECEGRSDREHVSVASGCPLGRSRSSAGLSTLALPLMQHLPIQGHSSLPTTEPPS